MFHRIDRGEILSRLSFFCGLILGQIGITFPRVAQACHIKRNHSKPFILKLGRQAIGVFELFNLICEVAARPLFFVHQQDHRWILAWQCRVIVQRQEAAIRPGHSHPEILGVACSIELWAIDVVLFVHFITNLARRRSANP